MEILLENIPNELSSAERLLQFEELTHLGLNYVFDTGHAHMNEGVETAFDLMKERIRSTHVHDNDGKSDSTCFRWSSEGGTIDWKKTMELLRSRGDQYPAAAGIEGARRNCRTRWKRSRQVFDRLEAQSTDESQ